MPRINKLRIFFVISPYKFRKFKHTNYNITSYHFAFFYLGVTIYIRYNLSSVHFK